MAEYYIDEDGKQAVDPSSIKVGDVLYNIEWLHTEFGGLEDLNISEYEIRERTVSETKRWSYTETPDGVREEWSADFTDGSFSTFHKGCDRSIFNIDFALSRDILEQKVDEFCRQELIYGEEAFTKAQEAIEFLRARVAQIEK